MKDKRVFVWNIPFELSENDVANCARPFGSVKHVYLVDRRQKIATDRALHSGYGFVEFNSADSAAKFTEASSKNELLLNVNGEFRSLKTGKAKNKKRAKKRVKMEPASYEGTVNKSSKPDESSMLEQIPIELWMRISSNLPLHCLMHLRLVSKSLGKIVNSVLSNTVTLDFKNVCFTGFSKTGKTEHCQIRNVFSPVNHWQNLRRLNLDGSNVTITAKSVKILANSLHSLEDLALRVHRINNSCFKTLIRGNRNLRILSCNFCSGQLSLLSLRVLIQSCLKLTHLTWNIEKIEFALGDIEFDKARPLEFCDEYFKTKSHLIRFLKISATEAISNELEPMLCALFPTTVVAHLSNFPAIEMPHLRQIVLSRNVSTNQGALDWSKFPSLESIMFRKAAVSPANEVDVSFLADPICKVKAISLRRLNIGESALRYLNRMKEIDFTNNCLLNDNALKGFLSSNTTVEKLSLRGLCQITGDLLGFIGMMLPRLEILNIADCPKIDNEAFHRLISARLDKKNPLMNRLFVIAPGCSIELDESLSNLLKSVKISLLDAWGDCSRWPIAGHFERSVIPNVTEEEWPLSQRICAIHRTDVALQAILDFDMFGVEDFDDFDEDDHNDADSFDMDNPDELEDMEDFLEWA